MVFIYIIFVFDICGYMWSLVSVYMTFIYKQQIRDIKKCIKRIIVNTFDYLIINCWQLILNKTLKKRSKKKLRINFNININDTFV